ncbi:MAG: hypothetical protein IT258_04735, partial [Saprospiraceae bacterium]|nr:hypothetical protein [Saprospiraceae bacterium]
MKKSLTLCLLLASLSGFGQLNAVFFFYDTLACPYDNSVTVTAYKDWMMYQTLDGTWDGPIDSTICISLKNTPSEGIDLQTVDLTRPIFLRNALNDNNKILLTSDALYTASAFTADAPTIDATYRTGTDCPDNICSGIIMAIEIPDETGTSTQLRWYTDIPGGGGSSGYFETCVPTEYMAGNYLREFIIKLFPVAGTTPNNRMRMNYASLSEIFYVNKIDEVIAPQSTFVDTSYNVPIALLADPLGEGLTNFMLHYADMGSYPSAANPYYVEGRPEINTPAPQTINLIISPGEILVPQPFTYLRGALVEGSDSIRHEMNLVNIDGDICLPNAIELVVSENSKYLHAGGHVNLEGNNSCMLFRNGGILEIADGVSMQYGQDGRGMLALRSGGQLKLGKNSSLLFDGQLLLQGIPTAQHPDPQFYLDLKPGMSLIFGEGAHITNVMSTVPDVKLNVYMNGGMLDDSKLNEKARQRINRIYPKPSKHFADNV